METFMVLSLDMQCRVISRLERKNNRELFRWTFRFAFTFSKCHQNLLLILFLLSSVRGSHMETGFWEARVTITVHTML